MTSILHASDTSILKELECPVCKEYLSVPIFQCISGHSICNFCKSKLSSCPICKAKFSETRNFTLEGIISKMIIECSDCDENILLSEFKSHKSSCLYQVVKCLAPGCNWNGCRYNIRDHIQDLHSAIVIQNNSFLKSHQIGFAVMDYLEHLFWVRRFVIEGQMFWSVQHIYGHNNEKFFYTISLNDKNEDYYYVKQRCQSCEVPENEIAKKEKYSILFRCNFKHQNLKTRIVMSKQN